MLRTIRRLWVLHEDHQNHHSGDHYEEAGKDVVVAEIVRGSSALAVTALMMSWKSADFNEGSQRGIRPRRVWQTIPPYWRA